jgi:Polyketide cyclase / dehydrase and lipid transport
MNVQRTEVVHISILAPSQEVIAFLSDMNNWKTWAPWIRSVRKSSGRDWTLDTHAGLMKVRFVESNSLGVLDHEVTLASGVAVLNSMRVLANGSGSELVMVLFQSPEASTEEFERDIQAVRDDLARLKKAAETSANQSNDRTRLHAPVDRHRPG